MPALLVLAALFLLLPTTAPAAEAPALPALVDDETYHRRLAAARAELTRPRVDEVAARLGIASAASDARRYDLALEQIDLVLELLPRAPHWVHANRSVYLGKLGRHDEAIASARRAIELAPDEAATMHAKLVLCSWLWASGEREAAERLAASVPAPEPESGRLGFYHSCLACFRAETGDAEAVEAHMQQALEHGDGNAEEFFRRDRVFDRFRSETWYVERFGYTLLDL